MRVTRRARHNGAVVVDGVSPFTILLRKLRGEVLRKVKKTHEVPPDYPPLLRYGVLGPPSPTSLRMKLPPLRGYGVASADFSDENREVRRATTTERIGSSQRGLFHVWRDFADVPK